MLSEFGPSLFKGGDRLREFVTFSQNTLSILRCISACTVRFSALKREVKSRRGKSGNERRRRGVAPITAPHSRCNRLCIAGD